MGSNGAPRILLGVNAVSVQRKRLANGLTVISEELKSGTISIAVVLAVGLCGDTANHQGSGGRFDNFARIVRIFGDTRRHRR